MPEPLSIADFVSKTASQVNPETRLIGHNATENIGMTPEEIVKGQVQEFEQASALATWVINHNRGQRPTVEVFTTGGQRMVGEILHVNNNQIQILFSAPTVGKVRVS